jgi:hypothetical protein
MVAVAGSAIGFGRAAIESAIVSGCPGTLRESWTHCEAALVAFAGHTGE